MQALRAAIALALGLSLVVLSLALLAPTPVPLAGVIAALIEQASRAHSGRLAEVTIWFDKAGRPLAHAVRHSSGSPQSDKAAVQQAFELASLRHPCELAGRAVLFRESFADSPQLD